MNYIINIIISFTTVNIEDNAPILKKTVEPKPEPLRVGDGEKLSTGKS